jgi:hypothetical protein
MKLSRLAYDPAYLLDFYEEILGSYGCLCERTWYDQLFVVPGGSGATFWPTEISETNLRFRSTSDSAVIDPTRDIFPGSPLTLSICETLLNQSSVNRTALRTGDRKLPNTDLVERRWNNQFPGRVRMQMTTPFVASAHFSLVAALRCEIQAVDQHWSQHRVAINLHNGEPDPQLAEQLVILEPWSDPVSIDWPEFKPAECRKELLVALEREAWPAVNSIKDRQSKYLQRELATVDRYYSDYEESLAGRLNRTRSDTGRSKMQERLEAARREHQIRRIDQIKRHEIHVNAHVDALLIVGEPAHRTEVRYLNQRQERQQNALWIPRTRCWVVEDIQSGGSN